MKFVSIRALFSCAASAISAALLFTACSGGGGNSNNGGVVPSAVQNPGAATDAVTAVHEPGVANLSISAADRAAALSATHFVYHLNRIYSSKTPVAVTGAPSTSSVFPSDLIFHGGPTLAHVRSHDVYLNCPSTCWGDPQQFIDNLNNSTFIHVTDQYVKSTANGRYTTGANVAISHQYFLNIDNVVPPTDLLAFMHTAAHAFGGGYGNIYHIFLPKGYDTCFDNPFGGPGSGNVCYSPDVPSTFIFCAYHGSVTFSDSVGHVIFSVEPYQNVPGCRTTDTLKPIGPQPPPNGQLKDSTDSVLSHEYFESITDPDLNAWFVDATGQEIGDICRAFPYTIISLQGHNYEIQREYSNRVHACVN